MTALTLIGLLLIAAPFAFYPLHVRQLRREGRR